MKKKLLIMSCILGISLLVSTSVFAKNNITINRLWGQDRYWTSYAIVSQGWTQSNYAVLVNSQNFPDAITASPLAKKYNAPILLTDASSLNDSAEQKLRDLGVKNVFIIGGVGVISSDVENRLKNLGIDVKRIWGQDRYETSVNVAKELGTSKGVFVVNGEHYEDALSVAPIADKLQYPIILVGKNNVSDTVKSYINNQVKANNGEINVIGGQDVLSDEIETILNPTKIYNQSTKYDRNLALIDNYKGLLDLSKVYMASDKGFADALSGSALAGMNGNPIILVGDSNQSNANRFISNNNVSNLIALGGIGVLSNYVVNIVAGNTSATDNSVPVTDNSIVTFKDTNLEKIVRDIINKPTGDIYKSDVEKITALVGKTFGNKIQDISGIENLTNLQYIKLNGNQINDISLLKGLTNLQYIELSQNQISDISPLKSLNNLQSLYLASNKISDISAVKGLTNLQYLILSYNQINDINAVEGLTNLKKLTLFNNQISDISVVKGLINLQELYFDKNQVNDISALKGLINLKCISFEYNQVSDISVVKGFTNLITIWAGNNQIRDISALKELTNLQNLSIDNNQVSDISVLKGLTNLKHVSLGTNISDADRKSLKEALPHCWIE